MDHNGQQQQEEQRRATACPKCDKRPVGDKFVYVRRGDYYPREPRCDECYADAQAASVEVGIRKYQDDIHYGNGKPDQDRDAVSGASLSYAQGQYLQSRRSS